MNVRNQTGSGLSYQHKLLIAVAVVLVLAQIPFRLFQISFGDEIRHTDHQPTVTIDEVMITRQTANPPPPPVQTSAVSEPADIIVEDELPAFNPDFSFEFEAAHSGESQIVENPDRPARVRRIREAVTPQEARDDNIQAEVVVTLHVTKEGRVEEVFVSEIFLIKPDGTREEVQSIGYGILQETMRAASGWIFTPAEHEGSPVATYSRHRFRFGG